MADTKIGVEEWRAEIERLNVGDPGLTVVEISAASGTPLRTVQKTVRAGVAAGRYHRGRGRRVDSRGNRQWVPVYEIVKQA